MVSQQCICSSEPECVCERVWRCVCVCVCVSWSEAGVCVKCGVCGLGEVFLE